MNERYALGHRHGPTAMLGKIFLLCVLSLFASGCALVSSSFPKGFVQVPAKLDAWENPSEVLTWSSFRTMTERKDFSSGKRRVSMEEYRKPRKREMFGHFLWATEAWTGSS